MHTEQYSSVRHPEVPDVVMVTMDKVALVMAVGVVALTVVVGVVVGVVAMIMDALPCGSATFHSRGIYGFLNPFDVHTLILTLKS